MPFHSHTLANGLQIIAETIPSARSVAVGFFVRTGSRDETAEEAGVSHFLEHMVFKGTPRRTFLDVNLDFDRIGADYNAFTSEENTVFHATVLPEYLPRILDILADILRPSLRAEDFEMEKKVIIEEIGMYDDQPTWSAYERAKQAYFGDHPLGHSVLGTVESITALKREQMQAYFDRRYVAPNITLAAAGNLDWAELVRLAEEKCGGWPKGEAARQNVYEAPGSGVFQVVTRDNVAQEHVCIISPGPAVDSPLRHAAYLLAMALGDDSGSRLYWALVDPGLADSADTSFHDYEGTGLVFTSLSCEPQRTQENLAIVARIFSEVQREGITEAELNQARSKVCSRVVRSGERPRGRMQALGMDWTYLHEYRTVDDELRAFDQVTLKTIRELLDRYPINRLTTLALGPLTELHSPNGR